MIATIEKKVSSWWQGYGEVVSLFMLSMYGENTRELTSFIITDRLYTIAAKLRLNVSLVPNCFEFELNVKYHCPAELPIAK